MSPTSLNRPIIEKGCIYNFIYIYIYIYIYFFFVSVYVVDGGHFLKSKP